MFNFEEEKKRSKKILKKEKEKREKAELEQQKAELQISVLRYYFNDKKTVDTIAGITGKTEDYIKNIIGL